MTALGSVFTPAKSTRSTRKKHTPDGTATSMLEIERGFAFVRDAMTYVEEEMAETEGLYRTGGVKSKVQLLLDTAIKKNKRPVLADEDYDTVTSSVKLFLRER